jgi:hypothetical protein
MRSNPLIGRLPVGGFAIGAPVIGRRYAMSRLGRSSSAQHIARSVPIDPSCEKFNPINILGEIGGLVAGHEIARCGGMLLK